MSRLSELNLYIIEGYPNPYVVNSMVGPVVDELLLREYHAMHSPTKLLVAAFNEDSAKHTYTTTIENMLSSKWSK